MTPEIITSMLAEGIKMTLLVSMPMLMVGLIVGLSVSIFSAVTQIQEMTLTFVPKIIAVFVAMMVAGPWILEKLTTFTFNLFSNIPYMIR